MKGLALMKRAKAEGSMADIWDEALEKWPDNTFVIFEHRRLTFRDTEMLANQMAHWLLEKGLKRGDVLSLIMENKAEYIAWWLAMTKIGTEAALINYNIKSKGLVHCITVAGSAAVVFDAETAEGVWAVQDQLHAVKLIHWGSAPSGQWQQPVVSVTHDNLLSYERDGSGLKSMRKGIHMSDNFGFIYTSGTTGLPKAARIMHVKFAIMGSMLAAAGLRPSDRMYDCLPIYHSSGGGIAVNGCILTGATLVLSKKFSASRFWPEIMAHRCTGFQYIGELGRYLVNHAKEHPEVKSLPHSLKFACGNGLRPEVWDDFQDGFRIPLVVEFYGSTEGNGALLNFSLRGDKASRGAVGRLGLLLRQVLKVKIVKFDVEAEEPIRGPDGFCIECAPREAGELLIFNDASDPTKSFKGYTDAKATSKKLMSDVFKTGDCWFRTGDLLSCDEQGYFFFVDRIGDTFRWRGENCSTMEISEVVSSLPGVEEANVYGVKVPGVVDGRACMVALKGKPELRSPEMLETLRKLCTKELPSFAQPLFIRFLPDMEVTGTFKHAKVQLREDGCDPKAVTDPLFWLDPATHRYAPFSDVEYQQLENGRSKL